MNIEHEYLDLVDLILETQVKKGIRDDRTGTGTYSIFGHQMVHDMSKGFPLLTTKKVFYKGIIHELLWFLSGSTNIKYLQEHGVKIWDEWADEDGELGPVYGKQWRRWTAENVTAPVTVHGKKEDVLISTAYLDQIDKLVQTLLTNPTSRRNLVIAFNPAEIPEKAPPACHTLWQVYVRDGKYLDLQLYQRSADLMIGVPFNIASYAMLLEMLAMISGLQSGRFIHTFGDVHIYSNHIEGAREQLTREPGDLPELLIDNRGQGIFDFKYDDFEIAGYNPHPGIKFEISV